ncbi:hypothetical protein ACM9ER_003653 [Vibrio alginolyticus]|uniref:hypothetical protein n=1 Tax=Vibrio TaxID=662 RepID=UPI000B2DA060|nr:MULTISPECIES: hypothetical protein [Vibrio]MCR9570997.1 hypothetical protein [Vibrio alginolyticus]
MAHIRVYPHNDLMNLAFYQLSTIRHKVAKEDEDAIALDCLSCLISLAFSVEAIVNFVGSKRVQGWKERDYYKVKISKVCAVAGLEFDKNAGLYKQIWDLKVLRDDVAHGKPVEVVTDVKTREELQKKMECPWDKYLSPENVENTYKAVKEFERMLFENCKIPKGLTLTSSIASGQ